jgi:hypothetical protein
MPRFAQRWSHRASQISQEYVSDCDISASPYNDHPTSYADREALLKRLSTVYDLEDAEATSHETPETALSKLNGEQGVRSVTRRKQKGTSKSPPSSSSAFPRSGYFGRPTPPQKVDSGYGTDTSSHEQLSKPPKQTNGKERSLYPHLDEDVGLDDDDTKSLYTMEQILRSPELLSPLPTPSPQTPGSHKKHMSFLKLASSRRGSSNAMSPSSLALDSMLESSPVEGKPAKSQKKLQKPMPDSVKRELKEQRRKQKEEQMVKSPTVEMSLVLPEPVSSFGRYSWEPETALPTPTTQIFEPTDVDNAPKSYEHGDTSLVTDDEGANPAKSPFSMPRSKSRGQQRSNNTRQPIEDNAMKVQRSWSFKRSQGQRSSDSTPSKPSGIDRIPMACLPSGFNDADDDDAPLWTDYSSVSRTLGCNPYDIVS